MSTHVRSSICTVIDYSLMLCFKYVLAVMWSVLNVTKKDFITTNKLIFKHDFCSLKQKRAMMQENLPLGFGSGHTKTRIDSYNREISLGVSFDMILSNKQIIKALTRLVLTLKSAVCKPPKTGFLALKPNKV